MHLLSHRVELDSTHCAVTSAHDLIRATMEERKFLLYSSVLVVYHRVCCSLFAFSILGIYINNNQIPVHVF